MTWNAINERAWSFPDNSQPPTPPTLLRILIDVIRFGANQSRGS